MQIQRMFEIVYILLQKRRVTAKELAEHFEVSTRTIYRDLDALSMAGIPLYTNKGHQGGIFLMEDYVLHRSMFSEEEQQKLMAALQSYHIADPQDVDSLLTKLSSTFSAKLTNWIDVDFVDWGSDHSANRKFLLLKDAILDKQRIQFSYHSSYGASSTRTVEPLQLLFKGSAWYLIGYCTEKQAQRYFKLNRMENLHNTKEHFERELDTSSLPHDQNEYKKDLIHLVLEMKENVAYRIFDEFDSSCFRRREDGSFLVTIDFPKSEWIYGYLMSFGDSLRILEPVDIRDEVINRMRHAVKQYE